MNQESLSRISLVIEPTSKKVYSNAQLNAFGPMLQGALMEQIDSSYASYLHSLSFNPYSQTCTLSDNKEIVWTVAALNSDAESYLLRPAYEMQQVELRAINEAFIIKKKCLESSSLQEILDQIKTCDAMRHQIRFTTPTAFKSGGEYVFMPTPRLIFQNLFMHYNQVYAGNHEIDEETIEYIASHVRISSYNLMSHYFAHTTAVSKNKIPAFVGRTTLYVDKNQSLQGLVGMLLSFGEYAGVGIKTSMGMGGMCCIK